MKTFAKLAAAALLGATTLIVSASSASAYVVCNRWGECWHVHNRYNYNPGFGIVVHDDNWRWRNGDRYRWHEHTGRGYWRNGVWITF